jgi:hypothetical protein
MSGEKPSVTELYAQWLKARGTVLEHLENRDDNNPAMEPAHAAEEDAIAGMIVTPAENQHEIVRKIEVLRHFLTIEGASRQHFLILESIARDIV